MLKSNLLAVIILTQVLVPPILMYGQNVTEKPIIEYVCPMYCSDFISDKPDICPVCNMDLQDKSVIENPPDHKLISPQHLNTLIKSDEDIVLLDVRSEDEFDGELKHLEYATLIPIKELENRLDELKDYKDRKIIVYCSQGIRSARGAILLQQNGFDAYSLIGGLTKWYRDIETNSKDKFK